MKLTKLSKEIIDLEYEKIELIVEYLKGRVRHGEDPIRVALAIYFKRHKDISMIDDDDD